MVEGVLAHNGDLGEEERSRGLRLFAIFMVVNAVSFTLVSGQIVCLYASEFGAGAVTFGILTSALFFFDLFQIVGLSGVRRLGPSRWMALNWGARYIAALAMLAAPFCAAWWGNAAAVGVIFMGTALFCLFRSLGCVSYLPVIDGLTGGNSQVQALGRVGASFRMGEFLAKPMVALFLAQFASTRALQVVIFAGCLVGFWGTSILFRVPQVPVSTIRGDGSLGQALRILWGKRRPFAMGTSLRYMAIYAVIAQCVYLFKQRRGMSLAGTVMADCTVTLGALAAGIIAARFIRWKGDSRLRHLITLGLGATLLALAISGESAPWPVLFAVVFIFALSMASEFIWVDSVTLAGAPPHIRTSYLAAASVSFSLAGGVGAAASGFVLGALGGGTGPFYALLVIPVVAGDLISSRRIALPRRADLAPVHRHRKADPAGASPARASTPGPARAGASHVTAAQPTRPGY